MFNNISMQKFTACQQFKQLPQKERDAILLAKAARKDAKRARREIAKGLPMKPRKTPQEIFNEDPDAFWEKVVYELRKGNTDVKDLDKDYNRYKEVILSITSSSHVLDIGDAIRHLNIIACSYRSALTTPSLANDHLKTALAFQAEFGTMSAGYNAKKCCPVPLPSQERLDEIREFYTSQKERLAAHYRLAPRAPE